MKGHESQVKNRQNISMNNDHPKPQAVVTRPTLLLVDGSSYLYRAFHAMPDLRAVPGDPTSAPTGAILVFSPLPPRGHKR